MPFPEAYAGEFLQNLITERQLSLVALTKLCVFLCCTPKGQTILGGPHELVYSRVALPRGKQVGSHLATANSTG